MDTPRRNILPVPSGEDRIWDGPWIQLQEQVVVLQQENIEDKQRIVHLEQVTEEFERRVSLLESVCGSSEMETEISGPLMAIAGLDGTGTQYTHSAEVLNTSCDFSLPDRRFGHISVTTTDGKTLVCGGRTSSGYSPSCLQFDYESKSWKEHSTLLSKYRLASSTVTLSRGTYLLGGEDRTAKRSSKLLATGSSVWTQGPRIPGLGVTQSCAAKLSDTELVILGGRDDPTQVRVYNEERDEWREWPRLTTEVISYTCVRLGDIVLIANAEGEWNGGYGMTVIFDIKTASAREVASLKYPRGDAAMDVIGGKAVILGGYDGSWEVRSDGEMWNMDTETWEEADIHLNIARGDFSLVTMAEEIECN